MNWFTPSCLILQSRGLQTRDFIVHMRLSVHIACKGREQGKKSYLKIKSDLIVTGKTHRLSPTSEKLIGAQQWLGWQSYFSLALLFKLNTAKFVSFLVTCLNDLADSSIWDASNFVDIGTDECNGDHCHWRTRGTSSRNSTETYASKKGKSN